MPIFFLVTMLCFADACMPMPILGPGTEEQCQEALVAVTEHTPLPPGYTVIGRCVVLGEPT